jgi:hypothetical protein
LLKEEQKKTGKSEGGNNWKDKYIKGRVLKKNI